MIEYTPSDDDLIRAWKAYRNAADVANAWVRDDDAEPAEDEARRALARVKQDAWDEGNCALALYYQSEGLEGSDGRHNPYLETED